MTRETPREAVEQPVDNEGRVVRRDGVLRSFVRGLFWPFSLALRSFRGFWWMLSRSPPEDAPTSISVVSSPVRQNLTGRKRLYRVTRLLLRILPSWAQAALGYPVSSSVGCSLSPEISVSPTKPHGKGSKRKQDELDDDEEEDHPSWVEVLSKELPDDEGQEEDPDYEVSTEEEDSEEYASKADTESDLEITEGRVVIRDVNTDVAVPMPAEESTAAV
ncbi:oogenesis-related [Cyprinodon tularosa]|uniref:oogenesis-related n=1 Tax=Cyprinodon tularosa TaxID=77115 RepID=UPI0018E24313|nr:oogenesis-related [Cyprinodon tularosa]